MTHLPVLLHQVQALPEPILLLIQFLHLLVVLLCLSTVYCRYHYVVDVLMGILTAALLVPLGNLLYCRFRRRPEAGVCDHGSGELDRPLRNPADAVAPRAPKLNQDTPG